MLRRTEALLKKGWTNSPGHTRRGGKNLAWRPKMSDKVLSEYVPLNMEHPPRRPTSWHAAEFNRLGLTVWPKEVGFYNAGDNFEMTPEMMVRLFEANKDEDFWRAAHNERVVVHLMPRMEKAPKETIVVVRKVLLHHIKRFGADHAIYNAVLQAFAFAKDMESCKILVEEMKSLGLTPNAQTYVNMMLACKMAGLPKAKAEEYFLEGIKSGALDAVMRLDTEFQMWWDQFERLGSFTSSSGLLSVNEEGAKPMPKNMWALWGWDRTERKFQSRKAYVSEQAQLVLGGRSEMAGTLYTAAKRQPWSKYRGLLPFDFKGPSKKRPSLSFKDAPPAEHNHTQCAKAW